MRKLLRSATCVSLMVALNTPIKADSYYEKDDSTGSRTRASPLIWGMGDKATPLTNRTKQYIVDGDTNAKDHVRLGSESALVTDPSFDEVSYRYSGSRAVKDLEEGVAELKGFGIEMADHIRRNGAAGIYNLPEGMLRQGRSIGSRIGNNVKEIGADTAHDMISK